MCDNLSRAIAVRARLDTMTPQAVARVAGCALTAVRQAARSAGVPLPERDDAPLSSESVENVLAALGAASGVWFIVRWGIGGGAIG